MSMNTFSTTTVTDTLSGPPSIQSLRHYMLWQRLLRLSPFQPRVPDVDIHADDFSAPDFDQLSRVISDAEEDIIEYEDDIHNLESIISGLGQKKKDMEQYTECCRVARESLSPIRKLPTEIMCEIFLRYQDLHDSGMEDGRFLEPLHDPWHSSPSRVLTALTLSSVCRLWRTISISTPQLWSRFLLVLAENCKALPHLLELYLSRSKQAPLSFHVYVDAGVKATLTIVPLLVAQAHRWFFASWETSDRKDETLLTYLNAQKDLPLLYAFDMASTMDFEDPVGIFTGAHTPRAVSLELSNFLHSNLRWDQIHFFRATDYDGPVSEMYRRIPFKSLTFVRDLAERCPAIRSLDLYLGLCNVDNPENVDRDIHLSLLERLCLREAAWYEVDWILALFTFPRLRRLSFDMLLDWEPVSPEEEGYPSPRPDTFSSFILRSQCSISVLRLEQLHSRFNDVVVDMLRNLPCLTELIVGERTQALCEHEASMITNLMEILRVRNHQSAEGDVTTIEQQVECTAGQNSNILLPLLEKLILEVAAEPFQALAFAKMVKSRRMLTGRGLRALQSVRLFLQWSSPKATDVNLPSCLRSLQGPGVEVIMSTEASRRCMVDEHRECWSSLE
ncbi:hypothetical protein D9758_009465 [Tetrapyrgos nigripes]|uniref:F-box domain-containing protein n=1 Tax=Tetrapyrgos nigripes TaxID=182062 RepID=A0A8H5G150_9AGAR|nr:hypothetical protein D9758_009465 [Tetrapyrgos nigripes]